MRDLWNRNSGTGGLLFCFVTACAIMSGCGYRPTGRQGALPENFTRIAVPLMENLSMEAGLEDIFTGELRRQFQVDPRVDVVPLDEAEVVLKGRIREVDLINLSYDSFGRVSAQRVRVRCEFELLHRESGRTLWRSGAIEAEEEFPVTVDYLLNEGYIEKALAEVAEDVTETAHELLLSGF